MAMISYAQNREDVRLARAFPGPVGFYLDVGAADPVEYSVTKAFYDRGWSGVNVEPQPGYFAALRDARPRDANLNVGLSDRPGTVTLYEAPDYPGWSTMEEAVAADFRGRGIRVVERAVTVMTLAELCDRYVRGPVDFLKIDVEGYEAAVLRGADFARWRPRVLVIEATEVGRPTPNFDAWEPQVLEAGYTFAAFDGLNRYYVRAGDEDLIPRLQLAPNVFDEFLPWEWLSARDDLGRRLAEAGDALARLTADRDAEKARGEAETARADRTAAALEGKTKEAENHKGTADYYAHAFECRTKEADELRAKYEVAAARAAEADRLERELADVRDRLSAVERRADALRTAYDTAVALLDRARAHADALRAEVLRAAAGE